MANQQVVVSWVRLLVERGRWHLQVVVSPRGLRVAHCGVSFLPSDELETSALEAAPALRTCDVCYEAYRSSSWIIPQTESRP